MSERYAKIFSLPENLYQNGAPVAISAGALLKDTQNGNMIAQLKLRNMEEKTIKAVTVCLVPYDIAGRELESVKVYQYLDLSVKENTTFGTQTPILLDDAMVRSYRVFVTEVVFADNTVWIGTQEPWEVCIDAQLLEKLSKNAERSENEYETAGTETASQKAEEKKPKKRKKMILSLIAIFAVVFFVGQIFSDDVVGQWNIEQIRLDTSHVDYSDTKSYVVFEADGDVRMHVDYSKINKAAVDLNLKWKKYDLSEYYDSKSQYLLYSGDTVVGCVFLREDDTLLLVLDDMYIKCSR